MCRGLSLLPGLGVVSASHDQTLRVWTLNGDCVSILQGHGAIIYSCAATDGLIASASEDNTARLWRPDGTPLQSIEHPGEQLLLCPSFSVTCAEDPHQCRELHSTIFLLR